MTIIVENFLAKRMYQQNFFCLKDKKIYASINKVKYTAKAFTFAIWPAVSRICTSTAMERATMLSNYDEKASIYSSYLTIYKIDYFLEDTSFLMFFHEDVKLRIFLC